MLMTLCYVYLWVRFQKCYAAVIRSALRGQCSGGGAVRCTFRAHRSPVAGRSAPTQRPLARRRSSLPSEETLLLRVGGKAAYITEPQVCSDFSEWTVLGPSVAGGPAVDHISFVVEATVENKAGQRSPRTSNKKVLKLSDYCVPLACSPGPPFKAVAQASVENFSHLGVAFMEDRLQLDNGLIPSKIVSVILQESTIKELLKKQNAESHNKFIFPSLNNAQTVMVSSESAPCNRSVEAQRVTCRKSSLLLVPDAKRGLEERRGSEPLCITQHHVTIANKEDHSLGNHMEGHGQNLHLSNCNECLELENSTILSVKYASAENIPDLPDDTTTCLECGDKSLDEFEDDANGSLSQNGMVSGKPPNVLIYTGGCQERLQRIQQLLTECINMEKYVIYPLKPQQVLSEPWLESTRLLVLAEEEPLTPQLQTRFLNYLSQGGRVLGLSSTLCPAGLSLEARTGQQKQVSTLSFTKEDSTELELSVLTTGYVFIRDEDGGGEVELWGELKGDLPHGRKDMVIIRITHGEDGGEAVLCQVQLEVAPDPEQISSEHFNVLKVSNVRRYEVLAEILTSLGLSCDLNHAPPSSPVHLLSTSQERKVNFLKWLRTRVDKDSVVKSSKASLKMVSVAELQAGLTLPTDCLALVTDPPESLSWDHFQMETYKKHLQTHTLGHNVLYADVTPTTMDLLEGLVLHLPEDCGLIAVAGRQTRGRGRGGNVWLSPLGCAMFTLNVKVALSSELGQRIPFLQHIAALAVVEAVRTLPGYQDIDLRVKWPNDIYYSNQIKVGGVLVTSTLMGPTFYLLVGCGFSVSNSNPTICINDLIVKYNREHSTSLEALDCAQLIGRTATVLESLISGFQEKGPDAVLPVYYKRWLHSGTRVHLWTEDGPEADVVGLDDNGFLQVHCQQRGVVSVEPDGNSFDMLRNLVVTKQS